MKGKTTALIVIGAVVVTALLIGTRVIAWKNHLVVLDEGRESAWAQIETQLQRRLDLIPNLVSTVKGYAAHEEEVLTKVTKARASVAGAGTVPEKMTANNQLTSALSRLMVVVEKYPDLKANQNFLALQDELAGTENRISVSRQRYNDAARVFNQTIRKIPYSLFASEYQKAPYYESDAGANTAPKVSF